LKVLLIYPGFVEGFSSYRNGCDWFNHGLGIISAILKCEGHEVVYLDCRTLSGWDDFRRRIRSMDFDLALVSMATVDFDPAIRIARIVKEKSRDIKVMVGGPHPTLATAETVAVPEFDYVFTHEAEITLPDLLKRYPDIPRVNRGEMPVDLDSLPFVDRDLAPDGETPWFSGLEKPYFSITASRGCLYQCTFCQPAERIVFGNKVRRRSVDNILDELESLGRHHGMRSFMIHDDCFTQYHSWADEFCEKKIKRGLMQPFACQTRSDIVCRKPDLIEKLAKAGMRWVLIGFESGSDRILRLLKKGTTVAENIESARICKRLGVKIFANYMFGIPGETKEEMASTVEMMRAIHPEIHAVAVFTPAPGSELYDYCVANDLIVIGASEGYRRNACSGPKIKGVDYDFVNRITYSSLYGPTAGAIRFFLEQKFMPRLMLKKRLGRFFGKHFARGPLSEEGRERG
jgi:radical SAM superfamily enzyme YgiQ (UPF0313 family)